VIELRRRVGLLREPRARLEARRQVARQHLGGESLEQRLVLDQVDRGHAAGADLFEHAVVLAERRSDQRIGSLSQHAETSQPESDSTSER
jgi:hypothetical protein